MVDLTYGLPLTWNRPFFTVANPFGIRYGSELWTLVKVKRKQKNRVNTESMVAETLSKWRAYTIL